MNKSSPQSHTHAASQPKQNGLISDITTFLAIVSAYLFLSLTYRFNILEESLDISLKSEQDLTNIYFAYGLVLVALKLYIWFIRGRDSQFSQRIQIEVGRSLFIFHAIICLYLVTAIYGAKLSFHLIGHILVWVVIAQLNQIFCGIFRNNGVIASLAYFGRTIELILIFGQVIRLFGIDFSDFI